MFCYDSFAEFNKFSISSFLFRSIGQTCCPHNIALNIAFRRIEAVERCTLPFTTASFQMNWFASVITQSILIFPQRLQVFARKVECDIQASTCGAPALHIIQHKMFQCRAGNDILIVALITWLVQLVVATIANSYSHTIAVFKNQFIDVVTVCFEFSFWFYLVAMDTSVKPSALFAMMNRSISNASTHFGFWLFFQTHFAHEQIVLCHDYLVGVLDHIFYYSTKCAGQIALCHGELLHERSTHATQELQGSTADAALETGTAASEGSALGGTAGLGGASEPCVVATESQWQPHLQI